MDLHLAPLVNGIHNEQMEKKVLRNDFSILSTVGQLYNSSCQSTPDRGYFNDRKSPRLKSKWPVF